MEPPEAGPESKDFGALISLYSSYVWNRLFGSPPPSDSGFLAKFSQFYRRKPHPQPRRRTPCLPLPLPSNSLDSSTFKDTSRIYNALEDIMLHVYSNLHDIQKNLQFWESRAEGSNARKARFMLFERGPRAFIDSSIKLVKDSVREGYSIQQLCHSASSHISQRITILNGLRCALATFLAQVYIEVDRSVEELAKDPRKSLPLLLVSMNELFLNLETSIGNLNAFYQSNFPDGERLHDPLIFERLPVVNQWTDSEVDDAISMICENLHKLDSYLSSIVAKYKKPQKITQYWIHYSCGAVGIAVCSMWLIKHSSLMGSPDIGNWIQTASNSTVNFFNDHVEQPLLDIRDELFETFRKRHKGVMELEEVQLTANSLHRMLLAFSEQTKGQKFPENASDQEMLEIVMARYEKELTHPIQNLLSGELARALLIQVQKLKLDIETAMLELNQILRANEINFAILAALPAFFLSLLLLMVIRAWLKQDTKAEGRGRVARIQRRLLIVEIERRIMQYQTYLDQGSVADAECTYGLMLYSLDRLYCAVERHAKATGEWEWLRLDLIDLAKPKLQTPDKFRVTSRLEQVYDCLLPVPKSH
ncbi:protein DGS1, mitochondrial isoform X2 [Punica granatum]|uniref:Protein DGS1, mitochondrial isoform X2 n=2 Tax=Punica granatum TaxID=22663 RepID=A0A218WNJ5_PUNGR|nr:protein DGS1, mitochondrial isoform X2 [Punica granatum]OWM73562.1 hypothetical protein CDL15_Pgr026661 [Punica granatum]